MTYLWINVQYSGCGFTAQYLSERLSLGHFCRWRGRFEAVAMMAASERSLDLVKGTLTACQTEWSGQQCLEQHYLMKLYQLGGMFEVASPQGDSLCPLVHARLTT